MTAALNPDYIEAVRGVLLKTPYFNLIGMELAELAPGRCSFRLRTAECHLQPFGVIHGGVLASILDAACFWAVFTELERDVSLTTIDLKINYLAPAPAGMDLDVRGESIRMGRTLGLSRAEARENGTGRMIGFATSTLMVVDHPEENGLSGLPDKFVGRKG